MQYVWFFLRLIPARAGNMHKEPARASKGAAHPRSRGEHREATRVPQLQGGSSPLARGTWNRDVVITSCSRLIPARAGNIIRPRSARKRYAAHPRSRGEHEDLRDALLHGFGSSPLARGTFRVCSPFSSHPRLIPARAGNILLPLQTSGARSAHPRSRGEHPVSCKTSSGGDGSSPLARGTCYVLLIL